MAKRPPLPPRATSARLPSPRLATAAVAFGTVIVGGAVFASVEESQGITTSDGVWWAVTTVTTVGYGGAIYPHSTSGRIIGITNMVVGIGFAAPGKTFPKVIEPCGQPH